MKIKWISKFNKTFREWQWHLLDNFTEHKHCQSVAILTHWGRVTHICVSKLTIIGSDNGLSPDRRQAIIWTSAEILIIGPLGTNFSEILIAILTFSFKKMRLKVSSVKRRPFCLGLNVLNSDQPHSKVCHCTKIQAYIWNSKFHGTSKNWPSMLILKSGHP